MPNVFDAAKYILERHGSMSAIKLQRLCYYAQAWSLAWNHEPLFKEDYIAWGNGPLCPELFLKTRDKFFICSADEDGGTGDLSDHQKDTIDKVLAMYAGYDALWLNSRSIAEDPWIQARAEFSADDICGSVITKQSMADYYGNNDNGI